MSAPNCKDYLRVLYAYGATIYSVCGLMAFMYVYHQYRPISEVDTATWFLYVYLAIRLAMAIVQIPVHTSILFSARYSTDAADYLTKRIGGGDLAVGTEKYYSLINKCNVGITVSILLGGAVLLSSWLNQVSDTNFYILELISLIVLTIILASRIYAYATNNVRNMFYLQWSVDQNKIQI